MQLLNSTCTKTGKNAHVPLLTSYDKHVKLQSYYPNLQYSLMKNKHNSISHPCLLSNIKIFTDVPNVSTLKMRFE